MIIYMTRIHKDLKKCRRMTFMRVRGGTWMTTMHNVIHEGQQVLIRINLYVMGMTPKEYYMKFGIWMEYNEIEPL